jgi:hypothetical protein
MPCISVISCCWLVAIDRAIATAGAYCPFLDLLLGHRDGALMMRNHLREELLAGVHAPYRGIEVKSWVWRRNFFHITTIRRCRSMYSWSEIAPLARMFASSCRRWENDAARGGDANGRSGAPLFCPKPSTLVPQLAPK